MSVFNPKYLPPLAGAKGHAFYLYHSPHDRVCPYRMAEQAKADLAENGAAVRLERYGGGHGWRGNVYADIRDGVEWLEKNGAKVRLATYEGGHGWRGNVYAEIRDGVEWLEKNAAKASRP